MFQGSRASAPRGLRVGSAQIAILPGDLMSWASFIACLLLFVVFVYRAWTFPILDPDYWWLRWAGDQMLEGTYPHSNALSWTAPDAEWITHEPLVELAYAVAGDRWVIYLRGVVISTTALVLGFITWRARSAVATALAFGWVTQLVIYGRTERALSWGNLMLALTVALLSGRASAWRFAAASIVVGLWANVHGSFVVGVFLVAIYSWRWGFVAAALTLANPAGWRLWELILGYGTSAGTKPFVHYVIQEWFAPDLSNPFTAMRIGLLLLGGGLILWHGPWRGRLIWAALAVLGLQHQRFMEIAAIAVLPWFTDALERLVPRYPMPSPVPIFAAATIGLATLTPAKHFDEAAFPPDFRFEQLAGRRIWNDYATGGFLGYHGAKVFWDPRVDCYPIEVLGDGSTIETSDDERLAKLDKWRIDTVVTARPAIINQLKQAGWTLTGRYGQLTLFQRPDASSATP
jgi:hypothetical protein